MDTESKSVGSNRLAHGERIHVDGQKAECTKLSAEGTGNILGNIPEGMSGKVIQWLFDVVISCTVPYSIALLKNKTAFNILQTKRLIYSSCSLNSQYTYSNGHNIKYKGRDR